MWGTQFYGKVSKGELAIALRDCGNGIVSCKMMAGEAGSRANHFL